jgi:hypothetical protein
VARGDLLRPDTRTVPLRRLTAEEADRVEFAGPLLLSRLQIGRFGLWRNSRWFVVETMQGERRMLATGAELRQLGVEPDR